MRVQVISNASNVHQAQLIGKTAIVIDVMRTASTIIAAIEAGARCVLPVETIMEAKAIAKSSDLLGENGSVSVSPDLILEIHQTNIAIQLYAINVLFLRQRMEHERSSARCVQQNCLLLA